MFVSELINFCSFACQTGHNQDLEAPLRSGCNLCRQKGKCRCITAMGKTRKSITTRSRSLAAIEEALRNAEAETVQDVGQVWNGTNVARRFKSKETKPQVGQTTCGESPAISSSPRYCSTIYFTSAGEFTAARHGRIVTRAPGILSNQLLREWAIIAAIWVSEGQQTCLMLSATFISSTSSTPSDFPVYQRY